MIRPLIVAALTVAVLAVAGLALREILAGIDWDEVRAVLHAMPAPALAAALALSAASYIVLTGYDVLSLRLLGRRVPYPIAAIASFTSYIFSHNLGFAVLTGGSARYRIYRRHGLSAAEVGQIMVTAGVTFWLGALLLLGVMLLIVPTVPAVAGWVPSSAVQRLAAVLILALLGGYVLLLARRGAPLRVFGWQLPLPGWRVALLQLALGVTDLLIASGALFVLLPTSGMELYPSVLVSYLIAIIASLVVHAPGGLGVFEAIMLVALPQVDRAALLAALLIFRLVYYLIPLAIGLLLFLSLEAAALRRPRARRPESPERTDFT
ncbi:lysylphosphatidylglycerol synthase domain-containing protein [Sphingomonas sp. BK345]|uniref:lysylphosphatidylglycerol synthase domain-containing protein n=1 Tax=Sphingomonas sp. BK345 TaxID=2586980 RepID=UPI00160CA421|nr:lysylphosphatidylglycerol synthase domain-containing protein [Sphingomonas sp. BK345]MBB3472043.1 phosphatidylglycerol lysyltransferase [Sphingomonas sp. BK345]